jgi:hypothetical protein
MKRDKTESNIRHKLVIEYFGPEIRNGGMTSEEAFQEAQEAAVKIAPEYRSRNGAGALWLARMIREAKADDATGPKPELLKYVRG